MRSRPTPSLAHPWLPSPYRPLQVLLAVGRTALVAVCSAIWSPVLGATRPARSLFLPAAILFAACSSVALDADELTQTLTDEEIQFFETHIRPVLVGHCYECHASDSENIRGELLLDSRESSRRGGESGPAVVPGNPDDSLLLSVLRYESYEMPPDERLSDEIIDKFEQWIATGAADPRDSDPSAVESVLRKRKIDLVAGRHFWSFRPVKRPAVPSVRQAGWSATPIDRFVLAKTESSESDLAPTERAEPMTLLRRAKFDLVGLPPSPAEIDDFIEDPSDVAFAKFIDRWIDSPRFGERWGRHWLDVARFAESSGGGRSLMFPHAWRFRDYVIQALNADLPFDQFIREQLAGDLLPARDEWTRDRLVTATGFLSLGPTNYELQDKEQLEHEVIDEQIDTIGRAFLGMTLGCARCHDHKFDPIPMTDYYALAGILGSTQTVVHSNVSSYVERSLTSDPAYDAFEASQNQIKPQRLALKAAEKRLKTATAERERISKESQSEAEPTDHANSKLAIASISNEVDALRAKLKELENARPEKPIAMSVKDRPDPSDTRLKIRGEIRNTGPDVPRGVVSVACPSSRADGAATPLILSATESGRLQLADWIASPDNPLTARVFVNRVWHFLMGEGIVRTPDNFGLTGRSPTHPELLDYLASNFIESQWSIKQLVRQIMLSRVYQLDSRSSEAAERLDPENLLLSRANRRRLDAEAIRDTILHVSGELKECHGGRTIRKLAQYDLDYEFDTRNRSVYVPRFRNSILDIFRMFDAANPNLTTGRRPTSVRSTQALYLMNSPWVYEQAHRTAVRLLATEVTDGERMDTLYLRALSRFPTKAERLVINDVLASQSSAASGWTEAVHLLFGSVDFRYLY